MKNIFIITKREYLTQVRKKSFIIFTLLGPLLLAGFGAFISYMMKANDAKSSITVVDKSGIFKNTLTSDDEVKYTFAGSGSEMQLKSSLKEMQDTDGLLVIPALQGDDFSGLEKDTRLFTNKKIAFSTRNKISEDMVKAVRGEKIRQLGLDEARISSLDQSFDLNTENIGEDKKSDSSLTYGVKSGLSMVLMYATFMFILIYGVRVMRSVLEEKNNRVVEIIISSVKPFELMMGKILGVTGVAITQFAVWILMAVGGALFLNTGFPSVQQNLPEQQASEMADKFDVKMLATQISHTLLEMNFPEIILVFILFFLLGYIFYSSIYAAIGSAVDNETETQQFTIFVSLPLMLAMYSSFTVMKNPDGPMAFWLSMVPLTSPVAMIARIPFGVPVWQILVSLLMLVGAVFLMIFIAAKVYRVGILMYGNKATAKELWRWIRS